MTTATTPDALSELARIWRRYEGDPDGALRMITETGCKALEVTRCSVWLLDDDRENLRCLDLFETASGEHSSGIVLSAPIYPFAFVMIVIAAVGVAQTTRQNRVKSLVAAFAMAAAVRIGGFGVINMVAVKPQAVALVYALPLGALVLATLAAANRMRPRRQSKWAVALAGIRDRVGATVAAVFRPVFGLLRRKPAGARATVSQGAGPA